MRLSRAILSAVLPLLFLFGIYRAAFGDSAVACPSGVTASGFITAWLVNGPYLVSAARKPQTKIYLDNGRATPRAGDLVAGGCAWTMARVNPDYFPSGIDGYHHPLSAVTYLYTTKKLGALKLWIGCSAKALEVYLNGKQIVPWRGSGDWLDGIQIPAITLERGRNTLELAVDSALPCDHGDAWDFRVRFADAGNRAIVGRFIASANPDLSGPQVATLLTEQHAWIQKVQGKDHSPTQPKPILSAHVRLYHGSPTLFINGTPSAPLMFFNADPTAARAISRAGVHLYRIAAMPLDGRDDGQAAVALFNERAAALVRADSQARFLVLTGVAAPPAGDWSGSHPGEMATNLDGQKYGIAPNSKLFFDDFQAKYARFIKAIEKGFGNRIVGYQISSGVCGEWYWSGCLASIDYSAHSRLLFRDFLKRKYHDDLQSLNQAWGRHGLTDLTSFAEAPLPRPPSRGDLGPFVDPARHEGIVDFYQFLNDSTVDRIIDWARLIKKTTDDKKLVGTFYGYTLTWAYWPASMAQHNGHAAIARLLRSKYIDFLASPLGYYDRGRGGADVAQGLVDSVMLHGKMFFNETDTRGYAKDRHAPDMPVSRRDEINILKRNFAYAFVKRLGMWWWDFSHVDWYSDRGIMRLFAHAEKLYEKSLQAPPRSVSQVAVVLDPEASYYLMSSSRVNNPLIRFNMREITRMGAPYDLMLLRDLPKLPPHHYKLYIFLNAFHVTPGQRSEIHRILARDRATAIWEYAPGLIARRLDVRNMQALTGIDIQPEACDRPLVLRVTNFGNPLTKNLPRSLTMGGRARIPTRMADNAVPSTVANTLPPFHLEFYAAGPAAIHILGKMVPDGRPGLVLRNMGQWKSVYVGAYTMPAVFLRSAAAFAGVHIYDNVDECLYANSQYLAIHTQVGGPREIRLPEKSNVYDAFSGRCVARNASHFSLQVRSGTTYLYRIDQCGREGPDARR